MRRELVVLLKERCYEKPVCVSSQGPFLDSRLFSAGHPGPLEAAVTVLDKVQGRVSGVLKEEKWPVPWKGGFWME